MLKLLVIGKKNLDQSKIQGLDKYKTISLNWHTSYKSDFMYDHDAVLVFNEWKPSNRIFIDKIKSHKIPVLYLVDGVIDWNYLHHNWSYIKPQGAFLQPMISDYLGVIGNDQKDILSTIVPISKIKVVGIPRLDKFKINDETHEAKYDVLVTTPTTPYLNKETKIQVSVALKNLKDFFSKKNLNANWRIRPDIASEIDVKSNFKTSLKNQISRSKCVISFSSTIIIESMLLGKPTGLLDFSNNPKLINTAWILSGKENIPSFIDSILNPSKSLISYQNLCLNKLLYRGNSSKNLINTLYQISGKKLPYVLNENKNRNYIIQKDTQILDLSDYDDNIKSYVLDAYTQQNEINVKTLQLTMTRIDEFINDTKDYKQISRQHIHSFLKRIHGFIDSYK